MKWTGVGLFLLDRWIVVHLHFLQKHLFKCRICSSIFFHAFVQPLSWFKCSTDFCHVRPNSVTCSPLSSPAMVPYVCKNVYAVCFFQPDLILCLLSNEPRSPRGSKLKPHAIYTDWTAGALLAKEVWVGERNYHGRFRLNQALDNSLCFFFQFFFKLCFFILAIVFLSFVRRGHFRSCWFRVSTLHLICYVITFVFIHSATDGSSPFSSLKCTSK